MGTAVGGDKFGRNCGVDGPVLCATGVHGVRPVTLGGHRCVRDRLRAACLDRTLADRIASPAPRPHAWVADCRDIRLGACLFTDPAHHRGVGTTAPDRSRHGAAAYALWSQRHWPFALTYYWGLTLSTQALISPALKSPDFPTTSSSAFGQFTCSSSGQQPSTSRAAGGCVPSGAATGSRYWLQVVWAAATFTFNSIAGTDYGFLNGNCSRRRHPPNPLRARG